MAPLATGANLTGSPCFRHLKLWRNMLDAHQLRPYYARLPRCRARRNNTVFAALYQRVV